MIFKALSTAGAMIALLAASSSYAVTPAKPNVAKNSPKIAQMSRARALMINNKRNLAAGEGGGGVSRPVLIALGAGLTGLGIAAAAGAFNSSK